MDFDEKTKEGSEHLSDSEKVRKTLEDSLKGADNLSDVIVIEVRGSGDFNFKSTVHSVFELTAYLESVKILAQFIALNELLNSGGISEGETMN